MPLSSLLPLAPPPRPPPLLVVGALLLGLCLLAGPARAQDAEYSMAEEQQPRTFVGNVARSINLQAQLPSSIFDSLTYSVLAGSSSYGDFFSVDQDSADLFTARRLDRESLCRFSLQCHLDFKVGAVSGSYFKNIKVRVLLNDVNDNAPRFNRSALALDISESVTVGASFTLEGATDDDTGTNNSVQKYILVPSDGPFAISFTQKLDRTSDVTLIVSGQLDRETQSSYALRLIASDGGVPLRTAEMAIDVTVLDNNDNAPNFTQQAYSATIGENVKPGEVILRVSATDSDEGVNARVTYRLSARQAGSVAALFSVQALSGEISANSLPPSGTYSVIVEAVDGGTPPKESQVVVEVQVIDTTNNPPLIVVTLLSAVVSEGAKLRSPVAHVSVEDPDSGRNGQVNCFSQSADFDLRQLEEPDMMVELARSLDREVSPTYTVTLFCQDNGSPRLNASATFTVDVKDINDNPPVFPRDDVLVGIREGDRIGEIVYTMTATDRDVGLNAQIAYRLMNAASLEDCFYILDTTGSIVVAKALDRESRDQYVLQVLATDGGNPQYSASATVTIQVEDLNDEVPVFSKDEYSFSVQENQPQGSFVGMVNATDPDLGEGGRVSFSLRGGGGGVGAGGGGASATTQQQRSSSVSAAASFLIQPNGTLVTKGTLDRESRAEMVFEVVAQDNGSPRLSSSRKVTVVLRDVNDNKPVFLFPSPSNRSLTLLIPVKEDAHLFKLNVVDADEGANSVLSYSLASANLSLLFSVDAWTGDVWAKTALSEDETGTYNMTFEATDGGPSPLSSRSSLLLTVKLNPDSLPIASDDSSNAVIAIGIVVATVVLVLVIVVVVYLVRKRDRDRKKLQYVNKISSPISSSHNPSHSYNHNSSNNNNGEKKGSVSSDTYIDRQNTPSMFFTSSSSNPLDRSVSPKLSIGFPHEPGQFRHPSQGSSRQWGEEGEGGPLEMAGKDEVDGGDLQTLNRVTSLRLQQAFEHISSIKSQLITGSDTGKPYEWREIHVPGRPEDFNSNSLSSKGTYNGDSGLGVDDDGVFLNPHHHHHHNNNNNHHPQPPPHHHNNPHHNPHHNSHSNNNSNHPHRDPRHNSNSSNTNPHPPPHKKPGTRSLSQPASDNSHDSSQQSCSSLPNLYLKPGSDILVFRPTSATSCESSPSMDDNCTTTSGSYSINFEELGGGSSVGGGGGGPRSLELEKAGYNRVQDVYV